MNLSLVYLFSDLCQVCRSRDLNQPSVCAATHALTQDPRVMPCYRCRQHLSKLKSLLSVPINALLHLKINEFLRSHDAGKVYPGEDYIIYTNYQYINNEYMMPEIGVRSPVGTDLSI